MPERLAALFSPSKTYCKNVFPHGQNFPVTLHQRRKKINRRDWDLTNKEFNLKIEMPISCPFL